MTVVTLTSPGANNWTVPGDVPKKLDLVECWGAGFSGLDESSNIGYGGGGGGAYSAVPQFDITGLTSIAYFVGHTAPTKDTNFRSAAHILAKGGATASGATGGQGGQASSGVGTTKFNGGNGGNGAGTLGNSRGGGGGGAGGPNGAGVNGANGVSGGAGGTGGAGSNGSGGAGGAANTNGTADSDGGGGGGGGQLPTSGSAGGGGAPGAGGGGGAVNLPGFQVRGGGSGANGQIRITYTPVSARTFTISGSSTVTWISGGTFSTAFTIQGASTVNFVGAIDAPAEFQMQGSSDVTFFTVTESTFLMEGKSEMSWEAIVFRLHDFRFGFEEWHNETPGSHVQLGPPGNGNE